MLHHFILVRTISKLANYTEYIYLELELYWISLFLYFVQW